MFIINLEKSHLASSVRLFFIQANLGIMDWASAGRLKYGSVYAWEQQVTWAVLSGRGAFIIGRTFAFQNCLEGILRFKKRCIQEYLCVDLFRWQSKRTHNAHWVTCAQSRRNKILIQNISGLIFGAM